jgi:hypothetical protein
MAKGADKRYVGTHSASLFNDVKKSAKGASKSVQVVTSPKRAASSQGRSSGTGQVKEGDVKEQWRGPKAKTLFLNKLAKDSNKAGNNLWRAKIQTSSKNNKKKW